jgi:hypothetical protein
MTTLYIAMVLAEADERAEALHYGDRLERMAIELDMPLWKVYVPQIRSQIALANGDNQAALRLAQEAADLAHIPVTRVNALPTLVEAELAVDRLKDADSHLDELAALCESDYSYYLAWAHVLRAQRLRLADESSAAESVAHKGLRLAVDIAVKTRIVDALEVVASVASDGGGHREASRLFGAAQRLRDESGYRRCISRRDSDIHDLQSAIGDDAFHAAYDRGWSLSLDEAVAYAQRARARRKSGPAGPA